MGCEIRFVKTDPNAQLPKRNHGNNQLTDVRGIEPDLPIPGTHDSGFDIFATDAVCIPAHGSAVVPTGIKVGFISPGYWWRVEARSGLSFKYGIIPHFGIIDNQYRGDTGVKLYNHSNHNYTVQRGERIAQLVVYPLIDVSIGWAQEVENTIRGENGFGSSGKL